MSTTTTTPCPPPDRSLLQRMDALERANEIRTFRAKLKEDIKAGRRNVATLLNDPPPEIHTMKVSELLLAMSFVGPVKVSKVLRRCDVAPSKTVAGCTPRQRAELVRLLPQRPVGICSSCAQLLVRLANDRAAASCECGASDIPHGFFDAARRAA